MQTKTIYPKRIITLLFIFMMITYVFAENPHSDNYILQQWGFASGNDPADPPTSTNYTLTGSAIGIISDEDAVSTNYGMLPGYYLGPIIGEILPPENVSITVTGGNVNLDWDAVDGANSYSVYSSTDPYASYETWTLEESGILVTNWDEPVPGTKLFYYVKASTSTSRYQNPDSGVSNIDIDKKLESSNTVNSNKYKQKNTAKK